MPPVSISILKTLAYFDMFSYPLLKEEIIKYLDCAYDPAVVTENLDMLKKRRCLFESFGLYSLRDDATLAQKRKTGNERATIMLKTAIRISRLLYQFPFVRGVGISGSLSKHMADVDADIDFFIITETNRLWIARTFMHLLKKISFLFGRQHWFCMNYYISADTLVINEKNIFTATEVVTLIPVYGKECFRRFFIANNWVDDFYPNLSKDQTGKTIPGGSVWLKKALEKIFANHFGNWLDNYWMELTNKRWLQKENKHRRNSKGELMGLKTSKYFARPSPELFQRKIMNLYSRKVKAIELTGQTMFHIKQA